jgi:DNA-binding response OmpR family regulator
MEAARVLVVEDEPFVGELVCEILGMHGYDGVHVENGRDGVERARAWRPDAVVLDWMLPDLDGREVCRALRGANGAPSPAVLILTGLHQPEVRRLGFEAGADRFLTKPFRPEDLIDELQSALMEQRRGAADAPRRRLRVVSPDEASCAEVERRLPEILLRATPLPPDEIESIARGALELVRRIAAAGAAPFDARWELNFDVYRDRLATVVSAPVPGDADSEPAPDLVPSLLSAIPAAIAHESRPAGDGRSVVLVRWHSRPA